MRNWILGSRFLPLGGTILLAGFVASRDAQADGASIHVKAVHTVKLSEGSAMEVIVDASGAPSYHARVEGKALLVELENADVAGAESAIANTGGVIGGVLTQSFHSSGKTLTRITVHLAGNAGYRLRPEGNSLHVLLVPAKDTAPYDGPIGQDTPDRGKAGAVGSGSASSAARITEADANIRDVRFEVENGRPCVVVALAGAPAYSTRGTSGAVRLELKKTRVPESLVRALDVTAYKSAVAKVSTFIDESGNAIIEVARSGDSMGDVKVEQNRLVWAFPSAAAIPSPIQKGTVDAHKSRGVFKDDVLDSGPVPTTNIHDGEIQIETVGGGAAGFASSLNAQAAAPKGRFNGRKIDLDIVNDDIHNVLRLFADVGRVNIVTADDVTGNITIRMRNVPWDQALDVVLQAKGLGMVRQGNMIRVAPLATLQKERELRLAQQKSELDLAPLETRLIPVSYAQANEIQARAKDFLSPRGTLAVDDRTNVLIARDVAGNLNHIEELVRSLDTQTPQVLVEARIVEATSQYARDIGIQWGGDVSFSPATGNPTGVAFPSSVGVAGGNYDSNTPTAGLSPTQRNLANPNFAVNLPAATGTGQGGALGLAFGSLDNTINLGVRLSAAESTGMLRIVSSPRILTLDNHDARINQGTLIPFAQVSAQGVQTTFQEAKLQLLVKPHVTADGSVSMHVKINRDEPDFNQTSARGDPTILKREAETDLLVLDGHTAVIGGIFTRNTGRNLNQVPFFGDIPILGVLFQRRRASDTRNELVIFLTPRIVNRAEALGR